MTMMHDPARAKRELVWHRARLVSTCDLTPTIREFRIELDQAVACPVGSHLKVGVETGLADDFRSYSVVEAEGTVVTIAVKRLADSRGGSAHMWTLKPGDEVRVTAPDCDFSLNEQAPYHLLLAGGVGVTPLVAMARRLADRGERVRMIYAARSAEEFAYREALEEALGDRLSLFDDSKDERPDLEAELASLPREGELYMCGPLGLMEAVKAVWTLQDRPVSHLRYETFGSSGRHAVAPFVVHVPRLGLSLEVPENRTMLDALEEAGVEVLSECRRGECGLCAVEVLKVEGEIDHRDVFFSSDQHQQGRRMCTCVSRVAGAEVTIDPAYRGDAAFNLI